LSRNKSPNVVRRERSRARVDLARWASWLFVGVLALPSSQAFAADDVQECIASHESAQVLRRTGKIKQARDALLNCAKSSCPSLVQVDCAELLNEIVKNIPTVVITARENGTDISSVKVSIDGELVTQKLDGQEIELNPGVHKFKVELGNWPTIEREILIVSGARSRVLNFDFGAEPRPPEGPATPGFAAQPAPPPPPPTHRPVQTITYILLGTTVLGGVGFGVLGTMGQNEKKKLEEPDSCKPLCTDDDLAPIKTRFLFADISLAIGAVSAVGALVTYVTRPEVPLEETKEKPPSKRDQSLSLPSVDVALSPSAGSVRIGGHF
jgi:hypothetical protein